MQYSDMYLTWPAISTTRISGLARQCGGSDAAHASKNGRLHNFPIIGRYPGRHHCAAAAFSAIDTLAIITIIPILSRDIVLFGPKTLDRCLSPATSSRTALKHRRCSKPTMHQDHNLKTFPSGRRVAFSVPHLQEGGPTMTVELYP